MALKFPKQFLPFTYSYYQVLAITIEQVRNLQINQNKLNDCLNFFTRNSGPDLKVLKYWISDHGMWFHAEFSESPVNCKSLGNIETYSTNWLQGSPILVMDFSNYLLIYFDFPLPNCRATLGSSQYNKWKKTMRTKGAAL